MSRNKLQPATRSIIPHDLFKLVLMRLSPSTLLRLLPFNRYLSEQAETARFWNTYLRGDQEQLHQVLVVVAKRGYSQLFSKLWYLKVGLMKENRSLREGHELALRGGFEELANNIWQLYANNNDQFKYIKKNYQLSWREFIGCRGSPRSCKTTTIAPRYSID